MLSAGFQAWKSVTGQMAECGNFTAELDQEFANKQPAAFAANPALYQIGGVSNDSVVAVLDAGTIRPLDDLVAKYGQNLSPNQLIKLNGKVYVIAMQVNDQTLMYRDGHLRQARHRRAEDLRRGAGCRAQKIKASGDVPIPLGATWKTGWNLGEDFVNLFLGYGGTLFGPDGRPGIKGEAGLKTLAMMKKLMAVHEPERADERLAPRCSSSSSRARSRWRISGRRGPGRWTTPRNQGGRQGRQRPGTGRDAGRQAGDHRLVGRRGDRDPCHRRSRPRRRSS